MLGPYKNIKFDNSTYQTLKMSDSDEANESHTCPRCGYDTDIPGNMKKHLTRNTICKSTENDDMEAFEKFKEKYFFEKPILFVCEKCDKGFASKYGYTVHVSNCDSDPNNHEIENSPLEIVMRGGSIDGMKIRKTNEIPPRVSVYDLIDIVTGTINQSSKILKRMEIQYENISTLCTDLFQFPGKYQRLTPVVNARGVVTIINLLPGPKAAIFRAKSADIIVRYIGGDTSLIQEIKRNAELQKRLPVNAPMALFGQDINARTIISAEKLVRVEGVRDLGVPSGVRSPNCVYCILIGLDPELNKLVFKFGLCENFDTRMTTHRKTYPHTIIVFVVSLGDYAVKPAEDTIKYFEKVKTRIVGVTTKDSTGREYFACLREDMDSVMRGIIEEIQSHHGDKIDNVFYKSQNLLISNELKKSSERKDIENSAERKDIDIEKEKTKQAEESTKQAEEATKQSEAAVKKAEIELEMMKLKIQYKL